MLGHPLYQLPTIRAIDPDQPQLFTGPAEPGKEQAGTSRVGHRGGRDDNGHQEPQRINQYMPFTPVDVFAFVVTPLSTHFGGLDALAIQTAGRGVLVATGLLAYLGAQGVVEALPVSAVAPLVEIPVDTRPLRILMGEHPPFDTPIDDIKDRIEHLPHIQRTVAPPRLGWRDQRFDTIPFGISEVCRVWFRGHPYRIPN